MATTRKTWTRDELVLVLRLYMRLPFGKLHKANPDIKELAAQLGRSPSSVGMKACNFASFDPALQRRGVVGLKGTSSADRGLWNEFTANPESIAAEAEAAADNLRLKSSGLVSEDASLQLHAEESNRPLKFPAGATEVGRMVRARRVQSFFRMAVLISYDNRCALSGIAVPELLTASHIIPWNQSVERRADPSNGIALNALFDRAFDRGLITFDANYRVLVSAKLSDNLRSAKWACDLQSIAGQKLWPAPQKLIHGV